MKKLLIYLVVIIFCLPNIFILYKTFNVLDNLDSLPKKTGWVKGYEYWGMGKKKNLNIYLASEQEVKQMEEPSKEGDVDISLRLKKFNFVDIPEIKFRDKITYYELEDDFVYKTSLSDSPKLIGVATERKPVSYHHLFVQIMEFYETFVNYAVFLLNVLVINYYERIFKTEKGFLLMFIPPLFYAIIFIVCRIILPFFS
jgi:hypothetical protein